MATVGVSITEPLFDAIPTTSYAPPIVLSNLNEGTHTCPSCFEKRHKQLEFVQEKTTLPPEVIRRSLGLVTPEELAAALHLQPSTLASWRSTGEGPRYVKLGKGVFYRLDDLNIWVWSDSVAQEHDRQLNPAGV